MKQRDQLYAEAIAMIEDATPQKESILYHNIYSLKVNGGYPFSSQKDVHELVNFLNSCD
ncbi:hypothetical protein SLH46_19970 [Draconibacterium sp. IB214405]|uniref:hypothetical protein n=1 Tax=Draconibacterium sp. IB214405 TaxID=3097352 RepID=UPI002A0CB55D|nr:hypothetical protein [Draconibacterium sp. IB214405]MDX8341486.1 hypothetical protein [Draconibacterium sp. IB214405]